jgi:hypothetical protein
MLAEIDESDGIRIINAKLRKYMGIQNPELLSDIQWAMRYKELEWLEQKEAETMKC